jgi:hypothetical protein
MSAQNDITQQIRQFGVEGGVRSSIKTFHTKLIFSFQKISQVLTKSAKIAPRTINIKFVATISKLWRRDFGSENE